MQNVSCNKYLSSTSSISFQSMHKRSCRATSRDTSKLQNLLATSCASNHRNSDRAYHRTKSEFGGLQLRTFAALWSLENRRLNCWHSRLQTVSTWEASEPVRCCQSNGYIACRGAKLKFANSKETLGMVEMIWKWLKRKSWQWVHCARNLLCQDLTLKLGSLVTNKRIWIRDADVHFCLSVFTISRSINCASATPLPAMTYWQVKASHRKESSQFHLTEC